MGRKGIAIVRSIPTKSGEVFLVVSDETRHSAESLGDLCMAAVRHTVCQFFPEPSRDDAGEAEGTEGGGAGYREPDFR